MQKNQNTVSRNTRGTDAGRGHASGKAAPRAAAAPRQNAGSVGRKPAPRRSVAPRRRYGRRASGFQRLLLRLSDLTSTRRGILTLCGGFAALIALIVVIALAASRGGRMDQVRETAALPASAPVSMQESSDTAVPEETAGDDASTPAPAVRQVSSFTMTPTGDAWKQGKYAPEPQGEGYLPVLRSAGRDDKVIAITVDDCFQVENLSQIIQLAQDVNGKLTIFPIGNLMARESLQEQLKRAHGLGFEIENHTWSHDGLYNLSDEELAKHIFNQDRALDYVLGINYHTHFLRPKGGDDRNDLRTHSYIRQLGYYGIAHWSVSGAMNIDKIKSSLTPGAVYLFHCTDDDLKKLQEFIPYATNQGYQLITMNEMFGYEANEEELLTDDPKTREIIPLAPYKRDYKTLKATTYDYAAYEVQQALIEKGFLTGVPDGVYGTGTARAAAAWQTSEGYTADGVLTPEQQRKLLGVE